MPARQLYHLSDLGLRDFERINAADAHSVPVNRKHYLDRLLPRLGEKPLQHVDYEFHRRVVVVEQQHFVERGLLGLGPRLGDDARTDTAAVAIIAAVSGAAARGAQRLRPVQTLQHPLPATATHFLTTSWPDQQNTQATT